MDQPRPLADVELEFDLRGAALDAYRRHVEELQGRFLDDMANAAWILMHDSDVATPVTEGHQRVTQRFFASQLEAMTTRLAADLEVLAIHTLADDDVRAHLAPMADEPAPAAGSQRVPGAAEHMDSATEPGDDRDIDHAAGQRHVDRAQAMSGVAAGSSDVAELLTVDEQALAHVAEAARTSLHPAGSVTERVTRAMFAEWLRIEHEEARALVDDATARAAMLRHRAASHAGTGEAAAMVIDTQVREAVMPYFVAALRDVSTDGDATETIAALLSALDEPTVTVTSTDWADVDVEVPADTEHPAVDAAGVNVDEQEFEAAFVAFWNALPAPTRAAMAAHRSVGEPLVVTSDQLSLDAFGDSTADVVVGTSNLTAAPSAETRVPTVGVRRLLGALVDGTRRRAESDGQRSLSPLSIGLAPVLGVFVTVIAAMVVIG